MRFLLLAWAERPRGFKGSETMSGCLALAYFVWTRHRLALSLIAGYWLALIVLSRIFPSQTTLPFALPCVYPFLYMLLIFSFTRESTLEMRESGFPSRLWHLPVPTYALVGWPILWGCGVLALAWLTLSWGALRPALEPLGVEPPLWWPALALAAALAWLQAITWTPFPLPWLRPLVLIALISPLVALVALTEAFEFSVAIANGIFIALMLAAYAVAIAGVSRARRGDGPYWTWPGWPALQRGISSIRARPGFRSPQGAQVWFEWRRVGLGFPMMMFVSTLACLPFISTIAAFIDDAHRAGLALVPPFVLHEVGSLWLAVSWPLIFAPFWASVCSWEMGKLPGTKRDHPLSFFLATRPISSGTFVRAKLEAAALSTLLGGIVTGTVILLWIALGGHAAEMAESFGALCERHPGSSLWIGLALFMGGALVMTWLQIVQGLWLGLAGRSWTNAIALLGMAFFVSLLFLGQWLAKSPQYWQLCSDLLPWLLGAAAALKGFLVFRVSRILIHRGLVARNIVRGTLAVWVLSAAGLFSLLYQLLPSDCVSVFALVLGIVLVLPLTRLLLAPLALDWNRHR
jgi:hypothetical protein